MDTDLQAIRDVVNATQLTDEARQTVAWCMDQLPGLYGNLARTYDAKYSDDIRRLVQAILTHLGAAKTPAARRAADAVTLQVLAMHERLGIPTLDLKPAGKRKSA
jgi:hypothetical protein